MEDSEREVGSWYTEIRSVVTKSIVLHCHSSKVKQKKEQIEGRPYKAVFP